MNLSTAGHLGGTLHAGSRAAGTTYAGSITYPPRPHCWMEFAAYEHLPDAPSLAGTLIQTHHDLQASTKGAGPPAVRSLVVEFELFAEESPQTCRGFLRLCAGQSASRRTNTYCYQDIQPCYRGTYLHKIIPRLCVQGGDLTMRVDGGANYFSSAGRGWFADENLKRRHNAAGLLSMANNGPNSNGSQFFITTSAEHEKALNGRHVCFGRVVAGLDDFLAEIAPYGDVRGRPSRYVVVVDCGEGPIPDIAAATSAPAADAGQSQNENAAENGDKAAPAAAAPQSPSNTQKSALRPVGRDKSTKRVAYAEQKA